MNTIASSNIAVLGVVEIGNSNKVSKIHLYFIKPIEKSVCSVWYKSSRTP